MPIIVFRMLADLIAQIEAHLTWRQAHGQKLADTTFGLRAVADGKLMQRLRDGGQITVDKMQRILAWIEADRAEIETRTPIQDRAA